MLRRLFTTLILLSGALSQTARSADLTAQETRWLQGIWPVVSHAREALALPLDLVVQPQDAPGHAPLALGFVDGRCKLVLSMRGNPQVQRQLDSIDPALLTATLELMAAHELGHCRRYLDGAWHGTPAGFVAAHAPDNLAPDLRQAWLAMRSTRREEGYGDLVGLAWTRERHPELYARLHAWLVAERSAELIPGSHHDTLDWLALAKDPAALAGRTMFEAAHGAWMRGLKD
ncbi:hypothetical protein J2X16_003223 [Pelomonas aquatica]|uniref:DUF2268 domain-containing protein n=1 Tax=Pelomonas aquatica TaxID=431058 RepID=A0ABU1ZB69_9BURK|nr:hypothetical protein [Pelomonas aquatica]MDR7297874.1 hypothetical protein [Pelomonas aquatica]